MRTPHFKVDGTWVEEVDGAFLKTWRVSGDWVALITLHRGSTQTLVATAEFLRMYNTIYFYCLSVMTVLNAITMAEIV